MTILTVLHFPDSRLRQKAEPVLNFDENLASFVDDMIETMYQQNGIGLAATQVGSNQRLLVIDISADSNQPQCFINPEILSTEGTFEYEEGCLSVPEIFEQVTRAKKISVKAYDVTGRVFEQEAEDLLAICIQHEIDHLDGKLFIDYLSPLKRQRIKKKLQKKNKQNT